MASMEPPLHPPPNASSESADSMSTTSLKDQGAASRAGRRRRALGLLLLGIVIFLWTATSFLASAILADHSYSKPYFVTYFNTSFFMLPSLPVLARKWMREPEDFAEEWRELGRGLKRGLGRWRRKERWVRKNRVEDVDDDEDGVEDMTGSRELLLGQHHRLDRTTKVHLLESANKMDLLETAKLSLEFCLLWFLANYFIIDCLQHTSVASSTILTSTSGVFTLIFGSLTGVENFTLRKLLGVLASLAGVALISSVDLSGKSSDDQHRGDFPEKSLNEMMLGNALALMSAVMYGVYSVLMKKRIPDESRISMPIFFAFVGLFNVLLLWPGFFILHFLGIETFTVPAGKRVLWILVTNAAGSMLSDIAWAYAVLLTSPIVVTVGLSMTIPLSLVGQIVVNGQTSTGVYWVGALVVVGSFVVVSREEAREGKGAVGEERGILEDEVG